MRGPVRTEGMYQRIIKITLAELNRSDVSPVHVEAWMRMAHGALDALCIEEFKLAVRVSVRCITKTSQAENDELAQSMGL